MSARPRDGIPPAPAHMQAAIPADGPTADLSGVLVKMGLFTLAMVVLPVGSYFVSRDYYWGDNLTGAGITAASMANLILVAFVIVALREDAAEVEVEGGKKVGAVGGSGKGEGKKDL